MNPLVIIWVLLLVTAVITVCIMRIEPLKKFFKQFILVENINAPQGILNYGDVLELLQREIKKSERYNFPISIILLEIVKNNSSKVDYLEELESIVKRSIRDTDVFGFIDLEDSNVNNRFICVLPHTKLNEGYDLSERLRLKLLQRLSLSDGEAVNLFDLELTDLDVEEFSDIKDPNQHHINISCGISELEYYEGLELLIERATSALEMAKIKSGNCTMPQPVVKEVVNSNVAKHLN